MNLTSLQSLLWALPLFTCLHVIEEFAYPGGFIQWMAAHNPRRLKRTWYYLVINAFAIIAGVVIAFTAANVVGYCAFIWFVTFLATNALSHLVASSQNRAYCPGSVTGTLLFFPLLLASYWRFLTDNVINWQSLALNAVSAFVVGYFFITVHRRGRVHDQ